jgi:hypothetical protein
MFFFKSVNSINFSFLFFENFLPFFFSQAGKKKRKKKKQACLKALYFYLFH